MLAENLTPTVANLRQLKYFGKQGHLGMGCAEKKIDGNTKRADNNFHLIRYVLAALVLYSHSYGLLTLPEPGVFIYTFGTFAVQCFFALSGYLVTLSCVRTSHLGNYALNRTLRILPALLIALLFSQYLGSVFDHFKGNPVPYIINGPVWTLSWEVLCYALCGLLWWLGLLSASTLGAVVASSWIILFILPQTGDSGTVVAPLLLLFFMGGFIALHEKQINIRISGAVLLALLFFISFDTNAYGLAWLFKQVPFLYGPNLPLHKYYQIGYLFCLPFALIWLAVYLKPVINLRNDYSYGIYVYGWPVQQAIVALAAPHPLVLFVSALTVTHCLAMLSWHLVEKRALGFKR